MIDIIHTVSFVHGVVIAVTFVMVLVMVWMVNTIIALKSELKHTYDALFRSDSGREDYLKLLHSLERELHLRVDGESAEIYKKIDEIYRYTDSRFDKFESKINKNRVITG
jgi:hypothetical protein